MICWCEVDWIIYWNIYIYIYTYIYIYIYIYIYVCIHIQAWLSRARVGGRTTLGSHQSALASSSSGSPEWDKSPNSNTSTGSCTAAHSRDATTYVSLRPDGLPPSRAIHCCVYLFHRYFTRGSAAIFVGTGTVPSTRHVSSLVWYSFCNRVIYFTGSLYSWVVGDPKPEFGADFSGQRTNM